MNGFRLTFLLSISLMLVACGNGQKSMNETEENQTPVSDTAGEVVETQGPPESLTNEAATKEDMQKMMEEIDYIDFELEVQYQNDQEYEVELEQKSDQSTKAKIEDEVNNINKVGEDAFNDLYPLVKQLTITQQTSKEEAIQEILTVFDLPEDYVKFDLEIKFKDGTKIEFEDRK